MNELNPTYLEADFNTLKNKLISILQSSDTFKDYNFEGSNITMLIELLSYLSEMNVYYVNKLAKNMFLESTEVYETASMMANLRGYYPRGYVSAKVDLNVEVTVDPWQEGIPQPGDQLFIPAWYPINTGLTDSASGEEIVYITTKDTTLTISPSAVDTYEFSLPLTQGTLETLSYTGEDVINNTIFLPFFNFDHGLTDDGVYLNDNTSIVLYINGTPWTRVDNFIKDYSNIDENDNIYRLDYNKFGHYNIRFSSANNVPTITDQIRIFIVKTLGVAGSISAFTFSDFENSAEIPTLDGNTFTTFETTFIKNITKDYDVSKSLITISNEFEAYNASDPESITELVNSTLGVLESQYRNVTSNDYKSHLETQSDVVKANAWGEQEVNPGDTREYNKVYLSVIPSHWDTSTIGLSAIDWIITPGLTADINIPEEYNPNFINTLKSYLEPRRYLNNFETFVVPDLVYFGFDIGIKVKRMFNFNNVKADVENKLKYYFSEYNRNFNEVIDFKDIHNYILDISKVSEDDKFTNVRGVENLIIRDIFTFTTSISGDNTIIYEPNLDKNYPQYTVDSLNINYNNFLRPIKLGYNQFPILLDEACQYINEG